MKKENTLPVLDRFVKFGIDRISFARNEWLRSAPSRPSVLPMYLEGGPQIYNEGLITEDEKRRLALTISWIFADIKLIANEVSAAHTSIKIMRGPREERLKDHAFAKVLDHPNSEMDAIFLWQYTVYWMSLRGKAYWYLAPKEGNPNEISEIWPIQADRVVPIIGKDKFVEKYVYTLNNGRRIVIDPNYVVFFRYTHPYNLWDGLSPLLAASLPMETEVGSAKWQRDTYVTGRGIPHSVISLDKTLNDRDFKAAASNIREDFEEERKVAIARAGSLSVETVGISPKELELIKSRQFTRDEIDTIYLLIALHDHASDTWLQAADRIVKDKVIWPLHRLLAGQLTVQVLDRFYGDDEYIEFDDVRVQDRSMSVQEANIYWRVRTVNEAREELGAAKLLIDEKRMPGYGELPVPLAIDPSFVTLYYDIGRLDPALYNLPGGSDTLTRFLQKVNQANEQQAVGAANLGAKPPDQQPSLQQSVSPKKLVNDQVKKSELKRYRKVSLKDLALGKRPEDRDFVSEILTLETLKAIQKDLATSVTDEEIRSIFAKYMNLV